MAKLMVKDLMVDLEKGDRVWEVVNKPKEIDEPTFFVQSNLVSNLNNWVGSLQQQTNPILQSQLQQYYGGTLR